MNFLYTEVSWNGGTPSYHLFYFRLFHYKPSSDKGVPPWRHLRINMARPPGSPVAFLTSLFQQVQRDQGQGQGPKPRGWTRTRTRWSLAVAFAACFDACWFTVKDLYRLYQLSMVDGLSLLKITCYVWYNKDLPWNLLWLSGYCRDFTALFNGDIDY